MTPAIQASPNATTATAPPATDAIRVLSTMARVRRTNASPAR